MFTLFDSIDSLLFVSEFWRVVIWATLAGAGSMYLYRLISPQEKLQAIQNDVKTAQKVMADYKGDLAGMWPLIGHNLKLALKRVGISFMPSLIAGLPMILFIVCLDHQHSGDSSKEPHANSSIEQVRNELLPVSLNAPIETTQENQLTEKGESPELGDASAEVNQFLPLGPSWMRGWLFLFMAVSTIAALTVRTIGGVL